MTELIWPALAILLIVGVVLSKRRRRHDAAAPRRPRPSTRVGTFGVGPGAAGTIYDWLNQDKRNAIEIIVEQKAEARDPETADDTVDDEPPPRRR